MTGYANPPTRTSDATASPAFPTRSPASRDYPRVTNANPKPPIRTASAECILEKARRGRVAFKDAYPEGHRRAVPEQVGDGALVDAVDAPRGAPADRAVRGRPDRRHVDGRAPPLDGEPLGPEALRDEILVVSHAPQLLLARPFGVAKRSP